MKQKPNGKDRFKQGKFNPINKKKYRGDPSRIYWRSSWELKVMTQLDKDPNVVEWSSEEFFIPYRSPGNGSPRRYFPDFLVRQKNKKGVVETIVIEVKPYKQTVPPSAPKGKVRQGSRFLKEAMVVAVNMAKFEAAKEYCAKRGWTFQVLTEKELNK